MSINLPIVNAPYLDVQGLEMAHVDDENITVAAGRARNSTNESDIILDAAVTVDALANGLNGLDIGDFANSTMYAVYVVGDSTLTNPTGAMYSADMEQPLLPAGYDMYRRIGWVLTDGTADLLAFWQWGDRHERIMMYDVGISELAAGSSATYAEVDLATSVPPIACEVIFDVTYTPDGATDLAEFLPFGSSATNGIVRFGYGVAGAQVGQAVIPCRLDSGVPKIQYKVTAGDTLTLLVSGYRYYI